MERFLRGCIKFKYSLLYAFYCTVNHASDESQKSDNEAFMYFRKKMEQALKQMHEKMQRIRNNIQQKI